MKRQEDRNGGTRGWSRTLFQKLATSTTTLQTARTIPMIAEARSARDHKQHRRITRSLGATSSAEFGGSQSEGETRPRDWPVMIPLRGRIGVQLRMIGGCSGPGRVGKGIGTRCRQGDGRVIGERHHSLEVRH